MLQKPSATLKPRGHGPNLEKTMPVRTTRTQATFKEPFQLSELDGPQPAGTYDVDTDEDVIEGNERTIYLRLATILYIRAPGSFVSLR